MNCFYTSYNVIDQKLCGFYMSYNVFGKKKCSMELIARLSDTIYAVCICQSLTSTLEMGFLPDYNLCQLAIVHWIHGVNELSREGWWPQVQRPGSSLVKQIHRPFSTFSKIIQYLITHPTIHATITSLSSSQVLKDLHQSDIQSNHPQSSLLLNTYLFCWLPLKIYLCKKQLNALSISSNKSKYM